MLTSTTSLDGTLVQASKDSSLHRARRWPSNSLLKPSPLSKLRASAMACLDAIAQFQKQEEFTLLFGEGSPSLESRPDGSVVVKLEPSSEAADHFLRLRFTAKPDGQVGVVVMIRQSEPYRNPFWDGDMVEPFFTDDVVTLYLVRSEEMAVEVFREAVYAYLVAYFGPGSLVFE